MKYTDNPTRNVLPIVLAATLFGLVAGFPLGYLARQASSGTLTSDLAITQQD